MKAFKIKENIMKYTFEKSITTEAVIINGEEILHQKNKMLVLGLSAQNVESLTNDELNVIAFAENDAQYTYYDDDGKTNDYKNEKYQELNIKITKVEKNYKVEIVDVFGDVTKKKFKIN